MHSDPVQLMTTNLRVDPGIHRGSLNRHHLAAIALRSTTRRTQSCVSKLKRCVEPDPTASLAVVTTRVASESIPLCQNGRGKYTPASPSCVPCWHASMKYLYAWAPSLCPCPLCHVWSVSRTPTVAVVSTWGRMLRSLKSRASSTGMY